MSETGRNLLIVDDDVEVLEMLRELLEVEGFAATLVGSGEAALEALAATDFDAVVLDIGLPGIDGMEVLRRIRARWTVPVIMLTARGDPIDRIIGLEVGADDYLAKPFHSRELLARLRGLIRRAGDSGARPALSVGSVRIDPGALQAVAMDEPLMLTGAEFRVLECLMGRAGSVVSRKDLCEQALDRALAPYDRSIDTHIANLRRKLRAAIGADSPIRTVRGVGFVFAVESSSSETT